MCPKVLFVALFHKISLRGNVFPSSESRLLYIDIHLQYNLVVVHLDQTAVVVYCNIFNMCLFLFINIIFITVILFFESQTTVLDFVSKVNTVMIRIHILSDFNRYRSFS